MTNLLILAWVVFTSSLELLVESISLSIWEDVKILRILAPSLARRWALCKPVVHI